MSLPLFFTEPQPIFRIVKSDQLQSSGLERRYIGFDPITGELWYVGSNMQWNKFTAQTIQTAGNGILVASSGNVVTLSLASLDAALITSGVLNNGRVNWSEPSPIGDITPQEINGRRIRAIAPGTSPSGSSIDLSSPAGRPGIIWRLGDGAGAEQSRYDVYIDSSNNLVFQRNSANGLFLLEESTRIVSPGLVGLDIRSRTDLLLGSDSTGTGERSNNVRKISRIAHAPYNNSHTEYALINSDAGPDYQINNFSGGFNSNTAATETRFWAASSVNTALGSLIMQINSSGVIINANLSKTSGTFRIRHPVVPDKDLVHSFVEAPRGDLIYRGKAQLVSDGIASRAVIIIDEAIGMSAGTFNALVRDCQVFLQNNQTFDAVRASLDAGVLTIECQNPAATAQIDWLIVGERKDPAWLESVITDASGNLILEPDTVVTVTDENSP